MLSDLACHCGSFGKVSLSIDLSCVGLTVAEADLNSFQAKRFSNFGRECVAQSMWTPCSDVGLFRGPADRPPVGMTIVLFAGRAAVFVGDSSQAGCRTIAVFCELRVGPLAVCSRLPAERNSKFRLGAANTAA